MCNSQFCVMGCLNGRPALITIPMNIYSKQDVRNSAVFSEFLMLDLSGLMCGGIYLGRICISRKLPVLSE